jgi:hypothetical protein
MYIKIAADRQITTMKLALALCVACCTLFSVAAQTAKDDLIVNLPGLTFKPKFNMYSGAAASLCLLVGVSNSL